jgi:hypothetical protein
MWFEERLVLKPQRAWDVAVTAFAAIIFAFCVALLLTSKAHAQDVITGEGIVCDTQEQVTRYILAADAKATLASINEEKANSCAIVNVAYYIGDEGEKIVNTKGVWQITHILVIGTVMHGGVRPVSPTAQWRAFAIETASASLPILLVDNEDGVAENRCLQYRHNCSLALCGELLLKTARRDRATHEPIPILDESVGFKTPPKNVYCVLEESWLRCDMKQATRPTPARPPGCSLEWGDAFVIEPDSRLGYRLCHGDTVADDALPALSYGSTWNQGGYSCRAEQTGLTCTNSIGHGLLSRNNQKVF